MMTDALRYYLAVDLGQVQEYTALAVVRRVAPEGWDPEKADDDRPRGCRYEVVHLQRFPPGSGYLPIIAEVEGLLSRPPLNETDEEQRPTLLLDVTSAGPAVVGMFQEAGLEPIAITITAGLELVKVEYHRDYHVPKRDLVSVMQVLLQTGRFKVAKELPEAAILQSELLNFKATINLAPTPDLLAWRETDDLVLAAAIACWAGENVVRRYWRFY
jgi:hypothetical protein